MIVSIWHSGFEAVVSYNAPLFFHVEVVTMLSNARRPRRRSQQHRSYQHIRVGNTNVEESEQRWDFNLNYVSVLDQFITSGLEAYCSRF
jgi:hypothetical protein